MIEGLGKGSLVFAEPAGSAVGPAVEGFGALLASGTPMRALPTGAPALVDPRPADAAQVVEEEDPRAGFLTVWFGLTPVAPVAPIPPAVDGALPTAATGKAAGSPVEAPRASGGTEPESRVAYADMLGSLKRDLADTRGFGERGGSTLVPPQVEADPADRPRSRLGAATVSALAGARPSAPIARSMMSASASASAVSVSVATGSVSAPAGPTRGVPATATVPGDVAAPALLGAASPAVDGGVAGTLTAAVQGSAAAPAMTSGSARSAGPAGTGARLPPSSESTSALPMASAVRASWAIAPDRSFSAVSGGVAGSAPIAASSSAPSGLVVAAPLSAAPSATPLAPPSATPSATPLAVSSAVSSSPVTVSDPAAGLGTVNSAPAREAIRRSASAAAEPEPVLAQPAAVGAAAAVGSALPLSSDAALQALMTAAPSHAEAAGRAGGQGADPVAPSMTVIDRVETPVVDLPAVIGTSRGEAGVPGGPSMQSPVAVEAVPVTLRSETLPEASLATVAAADPPPEGIAAVVDAADLTEIGQRSEAAPPIRSEADSFASGLAAETGLEAWGLAAMESASGSRTVERSSSMTAPVPVTLPVDADFEGALEDQLRWQVEAGVGEAVIDLDPGDLGALTIRIQLQGDQASLQILAAEAATRQLLQQVLPQLGERLSQAGLFFAGGEVRDRSGLAGEGDTDADGREVKRSSLHRLASVHLVDAFV